VGSIFRPRIERGSMRIATLIPATLFDWPMQKGSTAYSQDGSFARFDHGNTLCGVYSAR
jgi:hypothetical protein